MLHHLAHAEEVGQVFTQEIRDSLALRALSHMSLLLPLPYHLHRHHPYVCGYLQPMHAMQHGVKPGKVACQDLMVVALQVFIRERSVSPRHGKGARIVYPDLPGEFNLDPVNGGTTIDLALRMVPLRKLHASIGVRLRSKKIPTNG